MKKSLFYSIIGGIAIGLFFGGFFTYGSLNQSNDKISQALAIGGYGVIKGYHSDGTIFYEWEGHNSLDEIAITALSGCLSGLNPDPLGGSQYVYCTDFTTGMYIARSDGTFGTNADEYSESGIPIGCSFDLFSSSEKCDGWEARGTFNFSDLNCTPGQDCPVFNRAGTSGPGYVGFFNSLEVTPQEITPGDVIVVTISFNPS